MSQIPTELKVIAGTTRKDRPQHVGVEISPLENVPDRPSWITNDHAIAEWDRLVPVLTANRLLNAGNVSGIGMLCVIHGAIVTCAHAGETPVASLFAQYRAMLAEFGLTPAARGRVIAPAKPDTGSSFAKFRKRSA